MKTFVLLHPYGTSDGFKAVYSGRDPGRAAKVVADYKRAGWGTEIYRVNAPTFHDAVRKVAAR